MDRKGFIMSAYKKQIGGKHYKDYKIQPYEFIQANDLNYLQGVIIKYIVLIPRFIFITISIVSQKKQISHL